MPADPYTILRALLQAEAVRSTPKPESERASEHPHTPDRDERPRRDPNHN
ncbi:hypothetical protein PV755_04530 [Streptomyces caniscabiei]|uniref:Uncharacterized protein n=1 Tax=Streptomyces caniscabiei TaxID=2746961 RepID=A0A927QKX5_9ACTN|nr:hypothetical protein [Streptomyces caniscabiei]MBD9729956.1 hypothetical protein [Streptomyces caniscabiei]MDX3508194.1 hypothetical protein [Streptomyces caniscabiei]MDX3718156.1 hypothetical protein [Streptomyces caniscabiei]WEO25864.1 hypothetical protein IHE65_23265 [Streptomyces caniscabiei]